MTSEAALAKLSYVLGQPGLSLDDRKKVCTPVDCSKNLSTSVCTCVPADSRGLLGWARSTCVCFGSGRGIPCGKIGPMLIQVTQFTPGQC